MEHMESMNSHTKLWFLIFIMLFALGTVVMGVLSIYLDEMWTYERHIAYRQRTEIVKSSLLKSCYRINFDGKPEVPWSCYEYDDKTTKVPFKDMDIVLYCFVAGSAGGIIVALLSFIAMFFREKHFFRNIVAAISILACIAGALCAVSLAYISENKKVKQVVPSVIIVRGTEMFDKTCSLGNTFYVGCVTCTAMLLSALLSVVLLFVVWDGWLDVHRLYCFSLLRGG